MIYCVLLNPTIDKLIELADFKTGGTYKVKNDKIHEYPMGKAISVALTLKTLEEDSHVFALIGQDEILRYESFLDSNDILHSLFAVSGKTRSNLSIIDKNQTLTTHLRMPGFNFETEPFLELKSELINVLNDEDYVIISGSLPPLMNISYFDDLIDEIKTKTNKFVIDSSGKPLNFLLEYSPYLIKSNLNEIREIFGLSVEELPEIYDFLDDNSIKNLIKPIFADLINMKNRFTIITFAEFGALLIKGTTALYSYLEVENAASTVGCGDAFLAGLISGLKNNRTDEECLRLATACGAANTQKIGAGILDLNDIRKFESEIK